MHTQTLRALTLSTLTLLAGTCAEAAEPVSNTEQVVVPEVARRDIQLPRFPSRDFSIGVLAGTYSTQNFGASTVGGLRLGYHVTEDFFIEGVVAQAKVSDVAFRQVLPGGVFPEEQEALNYYNLSVGYNVLPGEVFLGSNRAKPFALYLIGGVGSTSFNQQRKATFNFGSGMRVYLTDRIAIQIDARDHVFGLDLLGKNQTTQNIELTFGLTTAF